MQFKIPMDVMEELKTHNIKGLFFVRQQRIPITYAQGLSIGVSTLSFVPMLNVTTGEGNDTTSAYYYESFLSEKRQLITNFAQRFHKTDGIQSGGLICLDADVNPQLQAILDGSEFHLEPKCHTVIRQYNNSRQFIAQQELQTLPNQTYQDTKLVYIPQECQLRYIDKYGFSSKVGSAMEAKQFGFVGTKNYDKSSYNFVRGTFTSFIGALGSLLPASIYSIKIPNYSESYMEEYFAARANDYSPFYSSSPRYDILNKYLDNAGHEQYLDSDLSKQIINDIEYVVFPETFRGDCYTNTITVRMNSNYIDPDVPVNDLVVDPNTWKNNYKGYDKTSQEDWNSINRADVNTVPMGH